MDDTTDLDDIDTIDMRLDDDVPTQTEEAVDTIQETELDPLELDAVTLAAIHRGLARSVHGHVIDRRR